MTRVTRPRGEIEEEKLESACSRIGVTVKWSEAWLGITRMFCERGLFGRTICADSDNRLYCSPKTLQRTQEIANMLQRDMHRNIVEIVVRKAGAFP